MSSLGSVSPVLHGNGGHCGRGGGIIITYPTSQNIPQYVMRSVGLDSVGISVGDGYSIALVHEGRSEHMGRRQLCNIHTSTTGIKSTCDSNYR